MTFRRMITEGSAGRRAILALVVLALMFGAIGEVGHHHDDHDGHGAACVLCHAAFVVFMFVATATGLVLGSPVVRRKVEIPISTPRGRIAIPGLFSCGPPHLL